VSLFDHRQDDPIMVLVLTPLICVMLLVLLLLLPLVDRVSSVTATVGDHYLVLDELPHDSSSFTQGLTWWDGRLFESSGLYSKSGIREISPLTGAVLQKRNYVATDFAEGITFFENAQGKKLIMGITWKERNGYIFDPDTLQQIKTFQYDTSTSEGWGITYNNRTIKEFLVTDGSNWLHFWDRDTLQETRRIPVMDSVAETRSGGGTPLLLRAENRLNELELMDGGKHVLANVWQTDRIVKIDIQSGMVETRYDFSTLYLDRSSSSDVLNGISATNVVGEYWVTGKLWPLMYRVRLL
jgi:glutaminyl-peptide cyclotransferase